MKKIEIKSIEGTKKSVEIIIDKVSYTLPALFKAKSQKGNVVSIKFEDSLIRTILIDSLSKLTVNDLSFSITSDAVVAINELSNFNSPGGSGGNNPAVWGLISGNIDAQTDLSERLKTILGIAEGAQVALVFDDKSQLDAWIAGDYTRPDGITISDARAGWNFFLRALDEPDFWWDGETIQILETKTDLSNYYDRQEMDVLLSGKQRKVIQLTCPTAAATAAKVITDESYALEAGDLISVKFTLGNTANSPTLNINGIGAKPVLLGGAAPTGASGTGAAYCATNGRTHYFYDGENFYQLGSNDITDTGTAYSYDNLYGLLENGHIVNPNSVSSVAQAYYPFTGLCEDWTIEKISNTTSSSAAGVRAFTTNRISLFMNIFFHSASTTAWTKGSPFSPGGFARLVNTNWKYPVGQYYDKYGVLQPNTVTTDLVQASLFVGGTQYGNYFVPSEYSITPRDTNLVYKHIGRFGPTSNFYLMDYQPVYKYIDGQWRLITAESDRIVTVHNNLSGRDSEDCHPIASVTGLGGILTGLSDELDKKIGEAPLSGALQIQGSGPQIKGIVDGVSGCYAYGDAIYWINADNSLIEIYRPANSAAVFSAGISDGNGKMYFGGNSSLAESAINIIAVDEDTLLKESVTANFTGTSYSVNVFAYSQNGRLFAGTGSGIWYLDPQDSVWKRSAVTSGTYNQAKIAAERNLLYFGNTTTSTAVAYIDNNNDATAGTGAAGYFNTFNDYWNVYPRRLVIFTTPYFKQITEGSSGNGQVYPLNTFVEGTSNINQQFYYSIEFKGRFYLCGQNGIYYSSRNDRISPTNVTSGRFNMAIVGLDGLLYFVGENGIYYLDEVDGLIKQKSDASNFTFAYYSQVNNQIYYIGPQGIWFYSERAGYLRENGEWAKAEHGKLSGRDESDSHPVSAITGLPERLSGIDDRIGDVILTVNGMTESQVIAFSQQHPDSLVIATDL